MTKADGVPAAALERPWAGWLGATETKKLVGILVMALLLYGALMTRPRASSLANQKTVAHRIGFDGIMVLGVAVVIISGGIDLSIGSVAGLASVCFALLIDKLMPQVAALGLTDDYRQCVPWVAMLIVLAAAPLIGLVHGLFITKLRLQPFLVTLCGLFIYRGLARWATWTEGGTSQNVGLGEHLQEVAGLKFLALGNLGGVPMTLVLMLALAALVALLLHGSVYGRYLYAIGANEQAARYAGIATARYKIGAYMFCSLMAALAGVLEMLEVGSASPAEAGSWYELYAITGAVLGGCSLRGGEGTVPGIILGAAILPLLRSLCRFSGIHDDLHPTVVGAALLLGTITDELLKRRAARRR
jgi:ribose transport system permease protein